MVCTVLEEDFHEAPFLSPSSTLPYQIIVQNTGSGLVYRRNCHQVEQLSLYLSFVLPPLGSLLGIVG